MSLLLTDLDTLITNRLSLIKYRYHTPDHTGDLRTIQMYPYMPDRDKKDTRYPCVSLQRLEVEEREGDKRPHHELFIPITPAITAATNASPIVVTAVAHGLDDGQFTTISGITGNTAANGTWLVGNKTTDTFGLYFTDGAQSVGSGTYTGGGTILRTIHVPYAIDKSEPLMSGPVSFIRKPYPTPINVLYELGVHATRREDIDWLITMMYQCFPPGLQLQLGDYWPLFLLQKPVCGDDLSIPIFSQAFLFQVVDVWLDRIEHWTNAPITVPDYDTGTLTSSFV